MLIQGAVIDALLGGEITRETVRGRDSHALPNQSLQEFAHAPGALRPAGVLLRPSISRQTHAPQILTRAMQSQKASAQGDSIARGHEITVFPVGDQLMRRTSGGAKNR